MKGLLGAVNNLLLAILVNMVITNFFRENFDAAKYESQTLFPFFCNKPHFTDDHPNKL